MRTVLDASVRPRLSGGALNQLRKDGFIPVSVSARAEDTQHGSVSRKQLEVILGQYGASALIEIKWPDAAKKVLVIARDIQRDPITHKLIHVGFQRLLARDDRGQRQQPGNQHHSQQSSFHRALATPHAPQPQRPEKYRHIKPEATGQSESQRG